MDLKEKEIQVIKLERKWKKEKELIERENKIKQEKKDIKSWSTTKLFMSFLFINCTCIELFTAVVLCWTIYLSKTTGIAADFSPLNTLIGAVVSEAIGFAVYSIKSAKENSKNGITYMKAEYELKNSAIEDDSLLK